MKTILNHLTQLLLWLTEVDQPAAPHLTPPIGPICPPTTSPRRVHDEFIEPGAKARPYQTEDAIMKIISVFIRSRKKSQAPRRRTDTVELVNNWTTRDWADLPVHHPRQD